MLCDITIVVDKIACHKNFFLDKEFIYAQVEFSKKLMSP